MSSPFSIYLDNNATTCPAPEVVEAMLPFLTDHWGNPSSVHIVGRPVTQAMFQARQTVARSLNTAEDEIIFTGSGTEASNLAIRGVVLAASRPCHVISSEVEHPATLETVKDLAEQGRCELTLLPVNHQGEMKLESLEEAIQENTCLVSLMWANNETGVTFPIREIGNLLRTREIPFHVDAIQAAGRLHLDWSDLPVDLMTLSGHKLHGPKGVGVLVKRRELSLHPIITGGGQEKGYRSGTENPAAIVGFAKAMELCSVGIEKASEEIGALRDRLQEGLLERIPLLEISGRRAERLANTLHLTLPEIEGETLLLSLSRENIACSVGSACSTGALQPSHVLQAMGFKSERLMGALRFSLCRETTVEEIDTVLETLPPIVERLRQVVG